MIKMFAGFLAALMIFGCNKANENYIKAVVVETSNLDCNKPLLDFSEDAAAIERITGFPDKKYVINNLPAEFNVKDKKLYVVVSKLKATEEFACTMRGVTYRHLKFVSAVSRD